jgi:hypothetical protein
MPNEDRLHFLYLRISIEQYHFLKFILEGYDGMGILSNEKNGIVVIRYPKQIYKDLLEMVSSIGKKIQPPIYIENRLT